MSEEAASTAFVGFLALLAAVGAVRLVELHVSRRRLRARLGDDGAALVREPGLFPLMVLLHVALLVAPPLEVVFLERPFVPALAAAAAAALVAAVLLRVWTLRTLGRAWNVRVVVPAEEAIATGGPYAWIRHPNYVVVAVEVAALPLLHGAWIAALALSLLNGVVLARRIRTEEAALAQVPAWRDAMRDRKRLIPGVF